MRVGALVKVVKVPVGFDLTPGDVGIVVENKERYWDFGGGDCGYVNVSDVMIRGEMTEIAHTMIQEIE
jgi:hypothetical protein